MGAADFSTIVETIAQQQLSEDEIAFLQELLANVEPPGHCFRLIDQAARKRSCPACGGQRCHRCGRANDLQRYRCVACGRTFNGLTGTPLARLRLRDKWQAYFRCLIESKTVRGAATQVAVAKTTSFRWRHRFLAGVRREPRPQLSGIVEADETYHLESQKGSRHLDRPARKRGGKARRRGISRELDCILVARDRTRHTCDFVTGRGPVTAHQLSEHLKPVLAPDVLLVSDGARAYQAFATEAGIMHEAVNVQGGIRTRGTIHIQGVNGWHSRFKTWLRRFNGVASCYLAHYTSWQRVLDAAMLTAPRQWLCVAVAPA
jgi:transposase-like protein